jgi:hypothetical protein
LPPSAYAGIPYQVLDERAGALALMMAWSRAAMARFSLQLLGALFHRGSFLVRESLDRLAGHGGALGGLLYPFLGS